MAGFNPLHSVYALDTTEEATQRASTTAQVIHLPIDGRHDQPEGRGGEPQRREFLRGEAGRRGQLLAHREGHVQARERGVRVQDRGEAALEAPMNTYANIYNEIRMEKDVLNKLRRASVIWIYHTFQNNDNLHFLFEFLDGGELLGHLMHEGQQIALHEDMARF